MLGRQQRLLSAFERGEMWLAANVGKTDRLAGVIATFTAELDEARNAARMQASSFHARQGTTVALHDAIRRLREHHLQRVVVIAQAQVNLNPEYAYLSSMRLPRYRKPVIELLAASRAIREMIQPDMALFQRYGCHPAFFESMDASIRDVERLFEQRNSEMSRQVGATAGLARSLSDARRTLNFIDSALEERFGSDDVARSTWRTAIRVRQKPGRKPS